MSSCDFLDKRSFLKIEYLGVAFLNNKSDSSSSSSSLSSSISMPIRSFRSPVLNWAVNSSLLLLLFSFLVKDLTWILEFFLVLDLEI